jgi:hypothetical protein
MVALILRISLALLALAAAPALAQRDQSEAQIKAAFLYKFGSFVEWPARAFPRPDSPFIIGVMGSDPVASALEQVAAGRTVQGRPIAVRKLRRGEALEGLHVLFVGQAEAARLGEFQAAARAESILLVTESENALSRGSIINFVVEDKVRFDIALPPAERGNLKISARLLTVARKIITDS